MYAITVSNPFVDIAQTGDHLTYDPLTISFKIDESFANYLELWNWMRGIAFPNDHTEHEELENQKTYTGQGLTSEIIALVLDSNSIPKFELSFTDAFPIYLSGFELTSKDVEVNYITAEATFKFTSFLIKAL